MKKLFYVVFALTLMIMLFFTGCKKDSFTRDMEGTHSVTLYMGTVSYNSNMIVVYNIDTEIFTITLTSGEDYFGQDIVLKSIRNGDVLEIQFEEDGYQGLCNVYGGTLERVDKKLELNFDACGLSFTAS